jgi:DNA polymerase-3 subunit beta
MSTLIVREILLKVLTDVNQAISPNISLEILKNFHVSASSDGMRISATDLEISISENANVISCSEPFEVAIPAEQFFSLIKILQDDILTISLDGSILKIKTQHSNNKLRTIPADEFPVSWESGKPITSVITTEFKKMVSLVAIAASTDQAVGGMLMGVYLEAQGNKLVAVSTDRYRFSIYGMKCDKIKSWTAIVPAKQLMKAVKALTSENIVIGTEQNRVTLEDSNTIISITTLDGQYPNYKAFPMKYDESSLVATIPVASMLNACRQIGIFAGEKRTMKMSFSPLIVSLTSYTETGASNVDIAIGSTGDLKEMDISCNPDLVAEILGTVEQSSVTFHLFKNTFPVLINSEGDFVHGIMPFAPGDI